jgi:hypothetical protein
MLLTTTLPIYNTFTLLILLTIICNKVLIFFIIVLSIITLTILTLFLFYKNKLKLNKDKLKDNLYPLGYIKPIKSTLSLLINSNR